jgi:ribonucleotide reductase alpha subunit
MKNTKNTPTDMYVIKRNDKKEVISFDKILRRIRSICKDQNLKNIIYAQLAIKVIDQLYDNIKTSLIDELTAEQCASMSSMHPDYNKLASAIIISNLHKNTNTSFYETVKQLYKFKDSNNSNNSNYKLIHEKIMEIVEKNKGFLESLIDYKRDYLFDYFGFKTLERAYLMRCNNVVVERPQHMWLRVSLCIHENDMEKVKETYDYMSQKYLIHATPTLFNAGTSRPQLSSCYLIGMESDSIDGIFNTLKECAQISKWSGGIGLHVHNIRPNGSYIRGTNGKSNGIIPMLGVFNKTARYVDQGGKRNGSFAIYLEPHHPDVEEFLELKKNHGDEESKARDLFYGLWISDLFMERVMGNKEWSLFCPDKCPGLSDCYGDKYKELYMNYESLNLENKKINARDLWIKILDSQMETGTPYILYKDAANSKSNQKNLGTIKSSNLCVAPETIILTDKGHQKIEDLKDSEVNVWNGKEFSPTIVKQTNDNSELIEVHLNDGTILTCTKYHKFYIHRRNTINTYIYKTIEAQNLKPGMNIIKCKYPIIDNSNLTIHNAYEEGFKVENNIRDTLNVNNVPINCSLKCKLDWFAGYSDALGYIINTLNEQTLEIKSFNNNRLLQIKLMLQTCGANAIIIPDYNSEYIYKYKKPWKMTLNSNQLSKLLNIGLNCKRLIIEDDKNRCCATSLLTIAKVINNGRHDKTFCFNEPERHSGIFNGIITSQCTEIIEYSDANETAVCNLASIGLPMFVKEDKIFDYDKLYEVTQILVNNLNNIIDINFYPTEKTRRSNYNHRPIGIGVQGLADTFFKMNLAFASPEAIEINKLIFETIYYAALEKSYKLSRERYEDLDYLKYEYGYENWSFSTSDAMCREYIVYNISEGSIRAALATDDKIDFLLNKHKPIRAELDKLDNEYLGAYSSFKGSPISNGQFQFDLWNSSPCSNRYDWQDLREKIIKYGIRNSLLCAPMPTASTSQILGNNECFEPITSNIYTRKTLAGEFILVNKYLIEELIELGIWNEDIKNNIIVNKGSVQYIEGLSDHIKEKYKIVWEIPMKNLIDMSRDRGIFICQSQSLNLWMEDPDPKSLTNMHFYSWRAGLKTGIYYLRRKAKHQAQQFTIEPEKKTDKDINEAPDEGCLMCSG